MESLKKNEDFRKCYRTGKSYINRYLILYVCGNQLDYNRIGISVSKKVGNSVVRHRITRLIREIYRLHEHEMRCSPDSSSDLAVIARKAAKGKDYYTMERAFLQLAEKAKIYVKENND